MKKRIFIAVAIFILIVLGFSGCIDEKSKFIGTWTSESGNTTLDFDEDNTVTISGEGPLGIVELKGDFEYSIKDKKITFSSGSFGVTLNYNFPKSDELLLSTDLGKSMTFIKQ